MCRSNRRDQERTSLDERLETIRLLARSILAESMDRFKPENVVRSGKVEYYTVVENFERLLISFVLELAQGSQTRAAEMLSINLTTLHAIIKRLKIEV